MPARVVSRKQFVDGDHCRETSPQSANTNKKLLPSLTATSKNRKPRTTTSNKEQTNNKTKRTRTRSVTFRQSVTVQKILHILDYTSAERAATWYNDRDFEAIRQDIDQAVKKLEMFGIRKCRKANPDFTIRGLESQTKEGDKDRRQNSSIARNAVLEQQKLHKSHNNGGVMCDPKYLAMIYMDETQHCQELAHEIGLDDEYVARKEWYSYKAKKL